MRHEKPALFDYAVASRAHGGASVSGDLHIVQQSDHDVLVAVVDGLGHGRDAEAAARLAISTLQSEPFRSISGLVERCHGRCLPVRRTPPVPLGAPGAPCSAAT